MRLTQPDIAPRGFALRRFAFREHGPAFWVTLWAAAVAAELVALVPVFEGDPALSGPDVVFILAAGSFAACGLVAWRRRPDNPSGRLMTATGFLALVYPVLSQIDAPLALTLGLLLYSAWTVGYVALLLIFTTGGRLEATVDRVLVGLYAVALLALQVVWMMFLPLEGNLLGVRGDPEVAQAIDDGRTWLAAGITVAVVLVLAVRWKQASRPRRKALLPGVVGVVSGLLYTAQLVGGQLTDPWEPLDWLTTFALLLVPAAYLFGLLRSRLARSPSCSSASGRSAARSSRPRSAGRSGTPPSRWPQRVRRPRPGARSLRSSATATWSRR